MAGRYWIGSGDDALFSDTANWSATSGGAGGSSVPAAGDTAIFDDNSGPGWCIIDVTTECEFDTYGNTSVSFQVGESPESPGTLTFSGDNYGLDIDAPEIIVAYGNLSISSADIYTDLSFLSGTTLTAGDLWALIGSLTVDPGATVDLSTAYVVLEDSAVLDVGSNNVNVVSVELYNSGNVTIKDQLSCDQLLLTGDGDIVFDSSTTFPLTVTGLMSSRRQGSHVQTDETSDGFNLYSTSGSWTFTSGTERAVFVHNCTITGCAASGADFYALTDCGNVDGGDNTGWTFETESNVRYWIGADHAQWDDINNWSDAFGGEGGASIPANQTDIAVFNPYHGGLGVVIQGITVECTIINDGYPSFLLSIVPDGTIGSSVLSLHNALHIPFLKVMDTFITNNETVSVQRLLVEQYGAGLVPVLSLGTSNIYFENYDKEHQQQFAVDSSVITGAENASLNARSTLGQAFTFEAPGMTVGELSAHNYSEALAPFSFENISNSFGSLSITGTWYVVFDGDGVSIEIADESGLTLEGNSGEYGAVGIYPSIEGQTCTISMTSGTCVAKNCRFQGCIATGGALFLAPSNEGNVDDGNNSGWNFSEISILTDTLGFSEAHSALLEISTGATDSVDFLDYYESVIWDFGANSIFDEEIWGLITKTDSVTPLWTFNNSLPEEFNITDSHILTWPKAIADEMGLVESTLVGWLKSLADTLFIYDTQKVAWGKSVTENLVLADAAAGILGLLISDWLTLKDSQSNNWNGKEIVPDTLNLFDIAANSQRYTRTVNEALAIADTNSYALLLTILDSLRFTDLSTAIRNISEAATDGLNIGDIPYNTYLQTISEALSLIDASTVLRAAIGTVTESLALADTVQPKNYVSRSISESLVFSETLAVKGAVYNVVYDTLRMNLAVELSGEVYECYVLNTPKFLPSMYSGFNFNSYCVFENRAFAANDDGIYELTGETDAGDTIHTGVVLSQTDFGSPNQKKFRRGYLGISGTNPVMILETEDGGRQVYTIDSNGKTVFSHEQKSKKWKLSVSDFSELDSIKLIPVVLSK